MLEAFEVKQSNADNLLHICIEDEKGEAIAHRSICAD